MENATRKIPYIIKLLEDTLSKERKNLDFWNKSLVSDDALIVKQAQGNISSNQERVRQAEEALLDLWPLEQRPKDDKSA